MVTLSCDSTIAAPQAQQLRCAIAPPSLAPIARGIRPNIVVKAVINIGRNLFLQACIQHFFISGSVFAN